MTQQYADRSGTEFEYLSGWGWIKTGAAYQTPHLKNPYIADYSDVQEADGGKLYELADKPRQLELPPEAGLGILAIIVLLLLPLVYGGWLLWRGWNSRPNWQRWLWVLSCFGCAGFDFWAFYQGIHLPLFQSSILPITYVTLGTVGIVVLLRENESTFAFSDINTDLHMRGDQETERLEREWQKQQAIQEKEWQKELASMEREAKLEEARLQKEWESQEKELQKILNQ